MLMSKKSILLKSVGVCIFISTSLSSAWAGDVAANKNATALPETEYETSLLKDSSLYPSVGLRKQVSQDCYCSGAYFSVQGGYALGARGYLAKGTPVVANPSTANELIPQQGMSGNQITGSAAAGYKFGNFRVEMSGEYRHHAAVVNTEGSLKFTANTQQYGALMSAFYDVDIPGLPVMPYVGLGAGLALTKTQFGIDYTGGTPASGSIDFSKGASFMGAAMAGVAVNVTDNIVLDLGYRLLNISGGEATYDGSSNAENVNIASGSDLINVSGMATGETLVYPNMTSHEVRAGIRYRF